MYEGRAFPCLPTISPDVAAAIAVGLVARARFLEARRPFAPGIADIQAGQARAIVGVIRSVGQLTVNEATVGSEAVHLGMWSAAEKAVIGAAVADQLPAKAAAAKHTSRPPYCPPYEEYTPHGLVKKALSLMAT